MAPTRFSILNAFGLSCVDHDRRNQPKHKQLGAQSVAEEREKEEESVQLREIN